MIVDAAVLRNNVTASQCARILAHLKAGNSLTALGALDEFGCNRLAARIRDLRDDGHDIQKQTVTVFNREGGKCRVAEYSMVQGNAVQDGVV